MSRAGFAIHGLAAALIFWAGLAMFAPPAAWAAVSAESESGFDRLRFSLRGRAGYTAQRFGDALVIEFSRPIDGDVAGAAARLGTFVASARAENGGREVIVELTGRHRFRTYRDGNDVVVDVGETAAVGKPPPAASTAAPAARPAKTAARPVPPASVLPVRVGQHADYRRVVFDWPKSTPYKVTEADGAARISFDRPASIDEAALRDRLPRRFAALRSERNARGGLDVVIPIPDGVRLRHLVSGSKVVVDLVNDPKARSPASKSPIAPPPAQAAKAPPPPSPTSPPTSPPTSTESAAVPTKSDEKARAKAELASKFGLAPDQNAAAVSPAEPVTPGVAAADGKPAAPAVTPAPAPAKVNATAPASAAGTIPPASVVPPASTSGAGVAISTANAAEVPADGASNPQTEGSPPRASVQGAVSTPAQESAAPDDAKSLVASLRALENASISGPALPVRLTRTDDSASLRFEWPNPVAAAVFTRAEHLWVVFDEPVTFDLAQVIAEPQQIMGRPEQVAVVPGSALRIPLVSGIAPRVWRDGNAWIVDLQPQSMRPDVPLKLETQQSSPQGPRVFVLADGVGRTIIAKDPEVGDQLFVVPISPLSRGIDSFRQFAQFNILSSVQGLAIQPLIDELEVRVLPDGVAITASKLRGLEVSKPRPGRAEEALVGHRADGLPPGLAPGRIFNLVAWRQGAKPSEFLSVKQAIQQRISEATSISRSGPRLSLAQFYFSNGLSAEAMGLLRTIVTSDEELARRPDVKALRGASQFMLGRFADAEADLDDRSLNGFAEAELWRGAANAAQGKWANAIEHFARAGEIPGGYPRNFATQLALLAAEAAIRAGDFRGAGGFLDAIAEGRPTVGEQARLNYLRGRVLYASGDVDTALGFWRRLSGGSDRWSRVRAKRALIEHNLRENAITRIEAIEDLESLRFTWRGDQLEFDLLRRLGNLYLEESDFVSGLEALRQAVVFFPNNIFARQVTKEMTDQFAKIYTDGTSDSMTPLSALSLYDQFRELTPVGRRGDRIIQRLADRLVQVDLLDRAAILLDRQVRFRLQGPPKAQVGGRLALIRLLDRQPEKALEALDESVAPGINAALSRHRKRLRARSIFELGDSETALKLLKADNTREADLLRADIYWRTQEWSQAAKVFQRLIGQAGQDGRRIDDLSATLIVNWVVTLSMSDQLDQLNRVRQVYTAQMDNTPYREAFRLITNRTEGELNDFRTLTARFEEIGRFQAFLSSYRDKLKDQPLSAFN